LLLALFPTLVSPAGAQSSIDDVHVAPRVTEQGPSEMADNRGLETHTPPIKKQVDLVLVPVTITDEMDRVITGLAKDNFQVFDGKQRQEIQHFSSEDVPVSVGIILDMSGSMKDKMARAREAISEFCRSANPQDEFFLIAFADSPWVVTDFTQRTEDVQSISLLTLPKGRTALLDAIYFGIEKMRQARHQRKALMVISDGGDNHSRYTEREVKSLVKEADVMIYAVGIYDSYFATLEERLGPQLLNDVAGVTGGRAFTIDNPNDLPNVVARIGMQLRNQYVLGYRPASKPGDGKWHKIKVKMRLPRGLPPIQVFAKAGYYAPTQ
jgi:Ca-activated chloride channel family protein